MKLYDSYDGVLDDLNVDVVYIFLLIGFYLEWVMKVVEKKKYVLLEKFVLYMIEEFDVFLGVIDRNYL